MILIILMVNVILGLVVAGDYGESWDEYGDFKYGEESLLAYVKPEELKPHGDRGNYGPFYLMVASVSSDVFRYLSPIWLTSEGRHFSNYLAFQVGVFFFYVLALRYMERLTAIAVTLLFAFQPLLFGHGFINQKDIPFMAAFSAAVALGLSATDNWARQITRPDATAVRTQDETTISAWRSIVDDWDHVNGRLKAGLVLSLALAGLLAVDLLCGWVVLPWIQETVAAAYRGNAWWPVNWMFQWIAQDAYKTPEVLYIEKATTAYLWLRVPLMLLAFAPAVVAARRSFAGTIRAVGQAWFQTRLLLLSAAVALGLCNSIRVAGPLAGTLVSLAFVARLGRKSIPPLLAYWVTAGLTMYATWPFLWPAPIQRLWGSIRLMGDFPSHSVLFNGRDISSRALPWDYLPRLLGLQLTEPAVLLIVIGALLSAIAFLRSSGDRLGLTLVGLWIGVPAAAVILFRAPVYGNLRQLLFILPPMFLLAGIGLSTLLKVLRLRIFQVIAICLVLIPGFIGNVGLHPYEYTYYNVFVGGLNGAAGRFETDPWCISYREAAMHVNQIAPTGATVAVWGPDTGVATFARKDLIVVNEAILQGKPDFVLACEGAINEPGFYSYMEVIYEVRRGKAILAVVKAPP